MVAPLLVAVALGLPSLLGLAGVGVGVHSVVKAGAEHERASKTGVRVGITN